MLLSKQWIAGLLFFPALIAASGRHGVHHTHAHRSLLPHHDKRIDVLSTKIAASNSQGGDYTCGPDTPCSNGACCGESGWCGYSPTYCGDGCQSNCDATAECGDFAATPDAGCPLNVCCSQYGFCGTTAEFCGDGCQSNCDQPKPSVQATNPQKRVIGYWEGWSTQRSCGIMSAGEIPVNLLTHLIIAFGYINSDFQVTNMDGLGADVYKQVGNLKARNPSLKIMIALGGWTFNDPGPWQTIFPTLASSAANRATFIQNLLGFLSEYGYDGVDFDWEYPGADDRGGSNSLVDGENYTLLLKELREAIAAGGRNHLVTFTAPTSYWYLRHFDLKAMVEYVDWVNLMSYDLHGIWDSENPIGSQVLAHTNLTEIDQALDLFWRVDVDPSAIVLGLGFYGRTFQLSSGACWKPGCPFEGPGAGGRCTATPGILSYMEIMELLENSAAKAHFDEDAAVQYLVYGENNWVSYDDATTFTAKIDYAKRMGLSGLMIWAVDLDDNYLTALRSIVDPDSLDNVDGLFTLVDLENLFPTEYLPPDGSVPSWGLSTVGGDMTDPSDASFGFLLVAGDSYAVTQLRRRDGLPDPFVFIDCPASVNQDDSSDTVHSARVVCLIDDLAGCFRVMERGVEGTLVEMPENCAPNTFARALSLDLSENQDVPQHIAKRNPTSQVFDFSFDFNFALMRRDTNNTSVRLDYSNAPGYWKGVVDSPGIQNDDFDKRFFAPAFSQWQGQYDSTKFSYSSELATRIQAVLQEPLFWQTEEDCPHGDNLFDEGFGAYVDGHINADFYYGFSTIGTMSNRNGGLLIRQANGFLKLTGTMDITYGIGGMGTIDISSAGKGNPAISDETIIKLTTGKTISTGRGGYTATFDPFVSVTYEMATLNGTDDDNFGNSAAPFDGRLTARVVTDLGNMGDSPAYFPNFATDPGDNFDSRNTSHISIPNSDVLYGSPGAGGKIALGTHVKFALNVTTSFWDWRPEPLEMSLVYNTMSQFLFYPVSDEESCTEYDVVTNIYQGAQNTEGMLWGENETDVELVGSLAKSRPVPPSDHHYYRHTGFETYTSNERVEPTDYFAISEGELIQGTNSLFSCSPGACHTCEIFSNLFRRQCCNCVNMDITYGSSDIPGCTSCDRSDGVYPGPLVRVSTRRRDEVETVGVEEEEEDVHVLIPRINGQATKSSKNVKACDSPYWLGGDWRYPAFPSFPSYDWEGIENGAWDSISRYWGNISDSCSSWTAAARIVPDNRWAVDSNGKSIEIRADYQTEHVFEGQLIGDFFDWWLAKGQIKNQSPAPARATIKFSCANSKDYFLNFRSNQPWLLGGERVSFMHLIMSELGSINRLDRLTIMLARPNGKKGSVGHPDIFIPLCMNLTSPSPPQMFTGNEPTDRTKYARMPQDAQLQSAKEMGMIISYLNDQEVWDKFCGTYEAIYDHFGTWDNWHRLAGYPAGQIVSMQGEWREYIRVVLDSFILRAKATYKYQYENRR
ncbi:hypothetical protein BJX99DRAFT_255358 [Aspergillus californicus]